MHCMLYFHVVTTLAASFLASFKGSERTERCLYCVMGKNERPVGTRRCTPHACCAGRYGRQRRYPMFWQGKWLAQVIFVYIRMLSDVEL